MADPRVLGIVLAGGEGKRLSPLTLDRAKPAVPFGGLYRMIDFALSNLVNAGVLRIAVLTQYKSHSLDRHITMTWRMSNLLGNYVTPVPAQQRLGPQWYTGSADAIYQSLNLIHDEKPDLVIVFGADHVYRMDPRQMVAQHLDSGAGATVAGIPVPRKEATAFGVIKTAADGRQVEAFLEKPSDPPGLPGRPDETYASMGNYVFSAEVLVEALRQDAGDEDSKQDMGGNIMPMMVDQGIAQVYDFQSNEVPGAEPDKPATGATSERWTPTSTRTWTCALWCRRSTSTTASGRSSPTSRRTHRRSSCTRTVTGSAVRSTAWSPTASSSLGRWCASQCCPPVCGCQDYATWNAR